MKATDPREDGCANCGHRRQMHLMMKGFCYLGYPYPAACKKFVRIERVPILHLKCANCGHQKGEHIYDTGACRPGYLCLKECKEFVLSLPKMAMPIIKELPSWTPRRGWIFPKARHAS